MLSTRSDVKPPKTSSGRGGGRKPKYPFLTMGVGDSFHVPKTENDLTPWKRLFTAASHASKRLNPASFIVRTVGVEDPDGTGARVFRIK